MFRVNKITNLTLMYWQIGFKINEDVLKNTRAEYCKEIVPTVSQQLVKDFEKRLHKAIENAKQKYYKNNKSFNK